jgi:hypothetical protein
VSRLNTQLQFDWKELEKARRFFCDCCHVTRML